MSRRKPTLNSPARPEAPETVPIQAGRPLEITEDERAILLGCLGRREAIQLRADQQLAALAAEEVQHLERIAKRLGLGRDEFARARLNLETREVIPSPAAADAGTAAATA